jgi:hypothetical protein
MALVIDFMGIVEACVLGFKTTLADPAGHERRAVSLRYGRWLVAGLTFQLAAGLNFFLERDLTEARQRQRESEARGHAMSA